jgi:hypothetical protein
MASIRIYFAERVRRTVKVVALGLGLGAIALLLFGFGYVRLAAVAGVIGLIVVCAGLLYLDRSRCPRCRARLSATASSPRLRRPMNFCPYCGLTLDAPHR